MHLQSLELIGFKSFPDKTIFNFHEGVTAVVGPNGCGKSNVLDAVRWVLGEQSAKSLRGAEMADVIFNGTDTRKPVGFAEVSLTLSNCAELGVDWHDVRVTRRIYRDGNSEYLLNKTVCRLKDVQSLFADTGVGRSAYSMMEQGKIDMILSSRPEDRRTVFEEAAGITKYKTQKREALRKLEATEANLLRIGDIIKEVKRQIGSLQRQAGKARRYQTLHADLQVLDTHYSRQRLDELEGELENSQTEIARLEGSLRTTLEKIEGGESDLTAKRRELDQIDIRIGNARSNVQRLQSELSAHRSKIEFNRQRAQELGELIERHRNDIGNAEAKQSQQRTQIDESNALIEKAGGLLASKENELEEVTQKSSRARAARASCETELQALQVALSKLETRISALEDDRAGVTARRETTNLRVADLEAAIKQANEARAAVGSALAQARASTEQEKVTLTRLAGENENAEQELQKQQTLLAEAEKLVTTIERREAENGSRLEILRQLNEEGEGLAKGSQAVLKGLDDPDRVRPSLAGALVSQLEVDPNYVAAIEAALGRSMHAIVLKSAELAPEIISALTTKKLGRAALVLPNFAPSPKPPPKSALPEGALAWASDKAVAPEPIAPLIQQLLRDVVLVTNLESALKLKKDNSSLSFATLAGEFISAEGIVFGGSTNAEGDSLLGRKARITSLTDELAGLKAERDTALQQLETAKSAIQSAAARLEETRVQRQNAQVTHSTSGSQIALFERELQEAEKKIEILRSEKITLEKQVGSADEELAKLMKELETERGNLTEQQAQQLAAEEAREAAREEEEKAIEVLNDLRLALATERQRHENLLVQREPMTARELELAELIADRRADIASYEGRLAAQADESRGAEAAIKRQLIEVTTAEDAVTATTAERASRLTGVTTLEAELKVLRDSLNQLHDLRGKQQVRLSQTQMQIDNLAEHVSRRYQLNLREFSPDRFAFEKTLRVQLKRRDKVDGAASPEPADKPDARELAPSTDVSGADLERVIAELTQQLDNMGPVNLDAVHEYDELEERHKFLETQNNDLIASRREVLDVIARINSTTQKLFAETFAQVRINFREMFGELFGGGRADLSLMDEGDPLNCGIDIIAKPPGKQLQSVSLLSGGERTMTAVALLFAIYMVRPSPFCILDEMDAPLDESNINRFIRVLERFVAQSQFIIITHNKRTIAKADVLYGVTMEERGVSKLVGIKLSDPRPTEASSPPREEKATQPQFPLAAPEPERNFAVTR